MNDAKSDKNWALAEVRNAKLAKLMLFEVRKVWNAELELIKEWRLDAEKLEKLMLLEVRKVWKAEKNAEFDCLKRLELNMSKRFIAFNTATLLCEKSLKLVVLNIAENTEPL